MIRLVTLIGLYVAVLMTFSCRKEESNTESLMVRFVDATGNPWANQTVYERAYSSGTVISTTTNNDGWASFNFKYWEDRYTAYGDQVTFYYLDTGQMGQVTLEEELGHPGSQTVTVLPRETYLLRFVDTAVGHKLTRAAWVANYYTAVEEVLEGMPLGTEIHSPFDTTFQVRPFPGASFITFHVRDLADSLLYSTSNATPNVIGNLYQFGPF